MSTLDKVSLDIQVVLGTTIEVDILANNLPVAKGTVVVSGNRIAVEVKGLAQRLEDMR